MLVSHSHQFIYLKTLKTAGTSIEIYFERYCADPSSYPGERHGTETQVSSAGVIGCRKGDTTGETWYNHMPGYQVRELVGTLWNEYFKFCAIRNPFEKTVSQFWFAMADEVRRNLAEGRFEVVRREFANWISPHPFQSDRYIYMIDGKVAVDDVIRYESLSTDMKRICDKVGIAWDPGRLGRYKGDSRPRTEHFSKYYDTDSERVIRQMYHWELEYFGYENK